MEQFITEQILKNNSWTEEIFYCQVGDFEDEDNLYLFVKGDFAIMYDNQSKNWMLQHKDKINYADGFSIETATVIKSISELPV